MEFMAYNSLPAVWHLCSECSWPHIINMSCRQS